VYTGPKANTGLKNVRISCCAGRPEAGPACVPFECSTDLFHALAKQVVYVIYRIEEAENIIRTPRLLQQTQQGSIQYFLYFNNKTNHRRSSTMSSATCTSEFCNAGWAEVLTHMSPYGYANFGVAFGLGLSVVGAAWGIWLTGSSLVGAAVKAPRIRSK
jgi:hypothetical protein